MSSNFSTLCQEFTQLETISTTEIAKLMEKLKLQSGYDLDETIRKLLGATSGSHVIKELMEQI